MDMNATARTTDDDTVIADPPAPAPKRRGKRKAKEASSAPDDAPAPSSSSGMVAKLEIGALRKAIVRLSSVVDMKSTMPMLHRVRIAVGTPDGERSPVLRIGATDLTTTLLVDLPVQVYAEGATTIECKRLRDLLRVLPDGDVRIEAHKSSATIEIGRCKATLETMSERDYPSIPKADDDAWHEMDGGLLKGMIEDTFDSICQDEARFYLCGALFESTGDVLRMVTTDGHRLVRSQRAHKSTFRTRGAGEMIPERALRELRRLLSDGPCQIATDKRTFFVRQGDWTLTTTLIDGQFPPYEQVIPSEWRVLATVDRAQLMEACKRSRVLTSETRGVRMELRGGALALVSDNPDAGELVEKIDADYVRKHDGFVIGLNTMFLRQCLQTMEGEYVVLAFGGELDPVMIRSIDDAAMRPLADAELVAVVMPMRI